MKAFAGATTFHAIALLAYQQPKSKPFNPSLIFIPKLSVSPHSASAVRKWACSHYSSKNKEFKVKANAGAEADEADEDDEKKLVRVKILMQKECMFGEQFSVVGTEESLGSWNPQAAIPMNWSPGHLWTTLLDIPVGKRIYFKFILTDKLGEIQWQPGPDRIFETWETTATIVVSEDWDSFQPQTITEELTGDEFAETAAETRDPIGDDTAEILDPDTDEEGRGEEVISGAPGTDGGGGGGGGGGGEVISGVPVLVPGLTKAFHADCSVQEDVGSDRNSFVSVMVAEPNAEKEADEEAEEEENSSYVEDAVETPTNHRSLVREEEETSSSAEMCVANEEEASTATELIENGDHAASSEINCNEEEILNSGNGQSGISVLQNDFDWGRKALFKLISSLGLKHQ